MGGHGHESSSDANYARVNPLFRVTTEGSSTNGGSGSGHRNHASSRRPIVGGRRRSRSRSAEGGVDGRCSRSRSADTSNRSSEGDDRFFDDVEMITPDDEPRFNIGGGGGDTIRPGFSFMRKSPERPSRWRRRFLGGGGGDGGARLKNNHKGRYTERMQDLKQARQAVVVRDRDVEGGVRGGRGGDQFAGVNLTKGANLGGAGSGGDGRARSAGSVRVAGGARGKEPAVQRCGIMTTFTFLKTVTALMMAFIGARLWTLHYHPSTGELCTFSNPTDCVTSTASKMLLTLSRVSAGGLFPTTVCCMLSKCYATRYFLHHSWVALVVSFEPAHELHIYFGSLALLFGFLHGVGHLARNFVEGKGSSLLTATVNRSGLVAFVLLFPIATPMIFKFMKNLMTFEVRKGLHMLFIPYTVALFFHGVILRWLCIILLLWYLLDRFYFTTRMSFYIEKPMSRPVGRGTFVRFDLPPGYEFRVGSYIQVNCPAISATQWHPFSIFPVPGSRPRAGFHAEAVGDWTQELFRLSLEGLSTPIWITAAQPGVLEKSVFFDNVLLVCTGAGITPAVCLADEFAKKKNVHLMWLSREAGMVAMFEKKLRRVKSTVHLTGNPSAKIKRQMTDLLAPSREVIYTHAAGGRSSRVGGRSSLPDLHHDPGGAGADAGGGGGQPISSIRKGGGGGNEDDSTQGAMESATDDGLEDTSGYDEHSVVGMLPTSLPISKRGFPKSHDQGRSNLTYSLSTTDSSDRRKRRLAPFGYPVSINFGRPDIEKFIVETIQGIAVEWDWPAAAGDTDAGAAPGKRRTEYPPPQQQQQMESGEMVDNMVDNLGPPKLRSALSRTVLSRLSTNQRMSKTILMSADLSVIAATAKQQNKSDRIRYKETTASSSHDQVEEEMHVVSDPRTWLVLYCGANAKIERAVATACEGLGVTWRKEYFSAW